MYSHGSQAWDEQLREAVLALDVDNRSHGIVSGDCRLTDKIKAVVHIDQY